MKAAVAEAAVDGEVVKWRWDIRIPQQEYEHGKKDLALHLDRAGTDALGL